VSRARKHPDGRASAVATKCPDRACDKLPLVGSLRGCSPRLDAGSELSGRSESSAEGCNKSRTREELDKQTPSDSDPTKTLALELVRVTEGAAGRRASWGSRRKAAGRQGRRATGCAML